MRVNSTEILGVKVPWISAQTVTEWNHETEEWETRELPPPFVTNLETLARNGSQRARDNATISAGKEAIRYLREQMGLKIRSYEAPLAVSSKVPRNCFVIKNGRIIVNEQEGKERAWDADGDRASILVPGEQNPVMLEEEITLASGKKATHRTWKVPNDWAAIRKYPITVKPTLFHRLDDIDTEVFSPLTKEYIESLLQEMPSSYDEEELFRKNHQPNRVGIYTNNFDVMELYQGQGKGLPFAMNHLKANPDRIKFIEGALKESRAGYVGADTTITDISKWSKTTLIPQNSWALLGGRSANLQTERMQWMWSGNTKQILHDAVIANANLHVVFEGTRQRTKVATREHTEIFKDSISTVDRLIELGILKFKHIPYTGEHPDGHKLPPTTMIWLEVDGQPSALIDTKRGGQLSYCYLLPPVFDPEAISTDDEGNWILEEETDEDGNTQESWVVEPKWVDGITHLKKHLSTFDWAVRTSSGVPIKDWPESIDDLSQYPIKTVNLQKAITTFCDRVGDQVPTDILDIGDHKEPVPTPVSLLYAQHSVYVEYQEHRTRNYWNTDEMLAITQMANSDVRICISGCKNANGKFMLAHPSGAAFLADPFDNPARTGKIRSQIIRGLGPRNGTGRQQAIWMRVAVVRPEIDKDGNTIGTLTQVHITPQGVEKQILPETGLPRIYTHAGWQESSFEEDDFIEEVDEKELGEETIFQTLSGKLRKIWVRDPKRSIKVGKLVDHHGNKFMPAETSEHLGYCKSSKIAPVDLIIPITELASKGNVASIIAQLEPGAIFSGGRYVDCLIGELPFFRTGAASENDPDNFRWRIDRGLDGMCLRWALRELDPSIWDKRIPQSIDYAVELINSVKAVLAKTVSEPEDSINEGEIEQILAEYGP